VVALALAAAVLLILGPLAAQLPGRVVETADETLELLHLAQGPPDRHDPPRRGSTLEVITRRIAQLRAKQQTKEGLTGAEQAELYQLYVQWAVESYKESRQKGPRRRR
jgi:hypothetical protein